ncbi:MAG TPA: aspartate-semialdehyde dehydrogenase [Candidatus Saccharimonadales bacterium]|nr:aspartate-semialdehyde dehydrogenase [Candidatus Saccharimonadales bacterium]
MERLIEEKDSYAIGIVGATGLVGQTIQQDLITRGFPVDYENSRLFASPKSAGKEVAWNGHDYALQYGQAAEDYEGLDIVFLSAGGDATKSSVSKEECPKVAEAGAIAIDNSSAWRHDPEVPLVISEVNPAALEDIPKGIVANPNCTTMIGLTALNSLHQEAGLVALNVTTLQSVSGQGIDGVEELHFQTSRMMRDPKAFLTGRIRQEDLPPIRIFPALIGSNVAPHAGTFIGRDTSEELKFVNETRKILDIADLAIQASCWRVPVINCHSLSISAEFEDELTPERAEELLDGAPGVSFCDVPQVPQPIYASGRDEVFVGRVRRDESRPGKHALQAAVTADNVRKGASTNAVQIAELLIRK